jgi:triosephosphate isomerase
MSNFNKPKIIIANWKMNPVGFDEADSLIKTIKKGIKKSDNTKIMPAVYLSKIKPNSSFELGIQNIFWENKGAYTGEISAVIVKNLTIKYAIIGHSERRKYLNETDEMVNLKIQSALKNNLSPILCVGETLEDKQRERASEVIITQVEKSLNGVTKSQILSSEFQIAYEPIWAIGTGETPPTNEIMSACLLIRKVVSNLFDRETAEKISILYGGSVNNKNAFDFVDKTGMNGLLVGGASLNGSEFVRIVKLFE